MTAAVSEARLITDSTIRKRKVIDEDDDDLTTDSVTHDSSSAPSPFTSSSPSPFLSSSSASSSSPSALSSSTELNPHLLRLYYERLFPCSTFISWLSPTLSTSTIKHREFSFTLKDDVYIRYLSFSSRDDLRKALLARLPYKLDIGAVYNTSPALKDSVSSFIPLEKELVLDVDMTDYDDVRWCCSNASICMRCWPLMSAAISVLDHTLRADFGFEHVMWVYSGRRGVHCWVCDPRARRLSNEQRAALIDYLSVHMGKDHARRATAQLSTPLHPHLQTAYETLLPFFVQHITAQRLLDDESGRAHVLAYFDDSVRKEFLFPDQPDATSEQRWEKLVERVQQYNAGGKRGGNKHPGVRSVLQRLVFSHVYPRLDVNVSKQVNHLLKAPFSVHPKTTRVCVPIDPTQLQAFDPFAVPTLAQLEHELNTHAATAAATAAAAAAATPPTATITSADYPQGASSSGSTSSSSTTTTSPSWQHTSLRPSIEFFKRFVRALQDSNRHSSAPNTKDKANDQDW